MQVLYDAVLKEKLPNLELPIELCDEEGHVLARIKPVLAAEQLLLEPQISEEEIERRLANPGKTYTTAEVLAYLESL